jgi:DNA-directed RNA polymerase specialized sigma24 family protein
MSQEPRSESLISPEPIPAGAHDFSKRMFGLLDGQPKDEATVAKAMEGMDAMVDIIAAGLYNLASMLVGEGEEGVELVETAIATAEVAVCHDPMLGRKNSRRALCRAAIQSIEKLQPGSLAAPEGLPPAATCLEDDELDGVGISREDLDSMIAGPDRDRVRTWLEGLPTAVRTIFVLRAVAGMTGAETAELLAENAASAGWTTESVRDFFRQGLCSLASQLLHAAR